ncbi:MAG: four helix bundle protein [Bacteroidales bacterium]|nr:four helix bundle protein [Bacteroidales bacterium]
MEDDSNRKTVYNLEERTFLFAKNVRLSLKKMKADIFHNGDICQLIRSSGSVDANYIEANESLSKKDFLHRIKISRKEAKESAYWIRLIIETVNNKDVDEIKKLYQEAIELKKIFSAIIEKSKV